MFAGHPDAQELAQRGSFALRNHLAALLTLCHVAEMADPEVGAALRDVASKLALDADVLVDLALASADDPGPNARVAELLREAIRPIAWLGDLLDVSLSVDCPDEMEAAFLQPREVVAAGRRLAAALVSAGTSAPVVLEARPLGGGILLAARPANLPLAFERLQPAPPSTNGNDLHLDILAWVLDRPGLRAQLLADGAHAVGVLLEPDPA